MTGNRVGYVKESGMRAGSQFIWRHVRFLRSTYDVCALTVSRTKKLSNTGVRQNRTAPPATISFDQQSSLQVNAASFLFYGYTIAIRYQDITGFGEQKDWHTSCKPHFSAKLAQCL
jgi:hypothetical protein